MIVTVVGWYGTETLGDIAILDGIISIFSRAYGATSLRLGSIYPFYSKRTLFQNKDIFKKSGLASVEIFDSCDKNVLKKMIKTSDVVTMGGGPIMDLEALYIIKRSFLYAKRFNIPSIVLGCGVGPLHDEKYISVVRDIFKMSDSIILRDELSSTMVRKLFGCEFDPVVVADPAIVSLSNWLDTNAEDVHENYLAVNFRAYPETEYGSNCFFSNELAAKLVKALLDLCDRIVLVPMHTFSIGGDDRLYLAEIADKVKDERVSVIHEPQSLDQLYRVYKRAYGCVGMRYHSVVMQTMLNGNNVVLNYADSKLGKISGFIKWLNGFSFYGDRTYSIKDSDISIWIPQIHDSLAEGKRYEYDGFDVCEAFSLEIKKILK